MLSRIIQDETHRKINALLAKKDLLFLDPFTEKPWEHPQIPRCAYPAKPVEGYSERFARMKKDGQMREKSSLPPFDPRKLRGPKRLP
jgi:hypothetical protein